MIYNIEIKKDEPHTLDTCAELSKEYSEKLGFPVEVSINYRATLSEMSAEQRQKIINLHERLYDIIQEANFESMPNTKLKKLGEEVTEIEYKLQELWGFPRSRAHHTHWLRFTKCTCPKLDNKDAWGHEYYINEECPVHGIGN